MNNSKSTNIVYKGLEDKGLTVRIIDENGKKWVVWKKQYGEDSQSEVYSSLLQFHVGESFGVNYTEKEKNYQGKNYTEKTIWQITPVQSPQMIAKSKVTSKEFEQMLQPKTETKDNEFWDKQHLKQSEWLYFIHVKQGKPLTTEEMILVKAEFKKIHSFVETGETVDVDNIPF